MLARLDPRRLLARCVLCGLRGGVLCPACAPLPWLDGRTPGGLPVLALGRYAGHLADCVRRLKYHDETHLAFSLGAALSERAQRDRLPLVGASLLPVPLHPLRLAERGYNQSALVARRLTAGHGARLVATCLYRVDVRSAQARLSAQERRTNLTDVFVARSHGLLGPHPVVFLLDDVVTTGSTVDACAKALDEIGVSVRGVLACALTATPGSPGDQSACTTSIWNLDVRS